MKSIAEASISARSCLLQWAGGREQGPELLTDHVRQVIGANDGVYLVDGSGLSYDDRVTPQAFVSYLARFPGTPAGRNFPQLLPANGTGTLYRLNSGFPGEGVVRAKTGTLGTVSTVVGYLGRPEGTLLVALMYNGPRPWAARQAQWRLFRRAGRERRGNSRRLHSGSPGAARWGPNRGTRVVRRQPHRPDTTATR